MIAGFAETLGIGALLPLISLVIDGQSSGPDSSFQSFIVRCLSLIGLQPDLGTLLSIIVVMIVAKATIIFFALRYAGFVAADMARDFQLRLIRALMGAQWQYFSDLPLGIVSNSIAAESQRAGHSYMLAGRTLTALIQVVIYLSIAFFVMWKLSVLAIILGGVLGFAVKRVMRMARGAGSDLTTTMDTLLARLNDSLSGAKPLKAMGQEERFCAQLKKEAEDVVDARKKQYVSNLLINIIYEPSLVICLAIALYYILSFTTTPISEVLLLAFLFHRLMGHVNSTQSFYQNMIQNENAVWSLQKQIEDAQGYEESLHGGKAPVLKKQISLENVNIAYKDGTSVFTDFSATIPAQKVTVIFGPSGIGKTTLTDALLGLLPLQSGIIKIDDDNLDDIDLRAWRHSIGYVPQDTFLFHDTIRQNVTLGDAFTDEKIKTALEKAAVFDFVESTECGIETIAGERGGKLSGGQRQRIALARALIRKPTLLILDEPTSALDRNSEAQILETLQGLSKEVAIIIISHNESVLKIADNKINLGQKDD